MAELWLESGQAHGHMLLPDRRKAGTHGLCLPINRLTRGDVVWTKGTGVIKASQP